MRHHTTALALLLTLASVANPSQAQRRDFYGREIPEDVCPNLSFASEDEANRTLSRICDAADIPNNFVMVACPSIQNCQAKYDQKSGTPYILYDPAFVNRVRGFSFTNRDLPVGTSDWHPIAILAHELGHHLCQHTTNRQLTSQLTLVQIELQADEYAGRILYKLGASLEQSTSVMRTSVVNENATLSHPGRTARIEAITRGYREAERRYPRTGGGGDEPSPGGNFLFTDAFADGSKEWHHINNPNCNTSIENGKFIFTVRNPSQNYYTGKSFSIDMERDFSASVIVRWQQGNEDNGHGLIYCSDHTSNSMNMFHVSANGYYTIRNYYRNGNWSNIVPWKVSDKVNRNGAPNQLKIDRQGSQLRFSINGQVVETLPFDGGYGNFFGLSVVSSKTVEFDNFRIEGSLRR